MRQRYLQKGNRCPGSDADLGGSPRPKRDADGLLRLDAGGPIRGGDRDHSDALHGWLATLPGSCVNTGSALFAFVTIKKRRSPPDAEPSPVTTRRSGPIACAICAPLTLVVNFASGCLSP